MRDYSQLRAGPLAGRQRCDAPPGDVGVKAEGCQCRAGGRVVESGQLSDAGCERDGAGQRFAGLA
jgi:hypothetical protein